MKTASARARLPVRWFVPKSVAVDAGDRHPHALPRAMASTMLHCLLWGLGIGLAAGATAGTLIIPILGTAYGMIFGFFIAVAPTIAGTAVVLAVLAIRHRRDVVPAAVARDLARLFATLTALLLAVGVGYLLSGGTDNGWIVLWATGVVTGTTSVVIVLLRWAAADITMAWCRPFGWRRAADATTGTAPVATKAMA